VAIVARSVFPLHGRGGLERHVYDLVRHLAGRGHRISLITRRPAESRPASEIHPNLDLMTIPYRTFPLAGRRGTTVIDRSTAYPLFGERAGRAAWELVRAGHIDVVHGLGASVLGYARRRKISTAPLVLNPQGLEEFGGTDPSRARLKRVGYLPLRRAVIACARAADRVIATDRSLEPAVLMHLRVPSDRVSLIPNAIDLDWLDSLATQDDGSRVRRRAGIDPEDTVILSVGRLEQNKGFHVLAEALGALAEHGALSGRWRWILAGDGPYRATLERAIERAGIAPHAMLVGRVEDADLHAWYEAATLFVHPTLYEGSSLVTLEAMAHRRAVVASNAGGLPDKVKPSTGWLVEPGRPSDLAAALSGALAQRPRLSSMGAAGRELVEREFAWPAVTDTLVDLYRELLDGRHSKAAKRSF
jgi:glycosyltransferase involved in cell wall biosynthesis